MKLFSLSKDNAQELLLKGTLESNLKKIDKALAAGADIDHLYSDEQIQTKFQISTKVPVVFLALWNNQEDIALALLERGANPLQALWGRRQTPLHEAVRCGKTAFIKAVADKNPTFEHLPPTADRPIFALTWSCNLKGLKALLAVGEDVNACNRDGFTPLWAIMLHKAYIESDDDDQAYVKALLNAGADLHPHNEKDIRSGFIQHGWLEFCKEHETRLRERLQCEQGAGMEKDRLLQDGKPKTELLHYCGADMLGEVFTPYRWKGKEAEALRLYSDIAEAVPEYYRQRLCQVDLTPLRRGVKGDAKGLAVARYIRPGSQEAER